MLVASIPWQFLLAIWEASTLQIDLESQMARTALLKSFATSLPQAFFDMAVGGGLIVLCRIDQRLEQKA
ncbi:hypothetical protein [Brevundimonas sp.]|uniref:hypothetical protein n=1 Tax=Brevundimonas sp. TaxID=1871086 RepID=UPI00286A89D1|nr:hypothetical protein [Brevundimonas sp.]